MKFPVTGVPGCLPEWTDGTVAIYRHGRASSSGRAERELGHGITPLAEGVRGMAEWLPDAGTWAG